MRWLLALVFGLISTVLISQEVKMYAYPKGDSVILVWLPDGEQVWLKGIDKGFHLYRSTIKEGDRILSIEERAKSRVMKGRFLCTPEKVWMEKLDTTDQWEILAAGMVYGDFQDIPPDNEYNLGFMVDVNNVKENRYLFNMIGVTNSSKAMERMGYRCIDRDIAEGDVYLYEIALGDSDKVLGEVVVQTGLKMEWKKVDNLSLENTQSGIKLDWEIKKEYVNYSLERSFDGRSWSLINETPIMTVEGSRLATFQDVQVIGGEEYQYRVRGKTIFDEWGPYSEAVKIQRNDIEEEGQLLFTSFLEKENGLSVEWSYEGGSGLQSLDLMYAEHYDGPYRAIVQLENSIKGSYDVSEDLNSGYIQLTGKDVHGRVIKSIKRLYNPVDIKAPGVPNFIKCRVDTISSGIELEWDPVNDQDLKGYRIYFSNSESGSFVDMGRGVMPGTSWSIPLKSDTNGDTLFFKVQSVDNRFNASELSPSCAVVLPDRSSPAAPLIRKVTEDGSHLIIEWAISPSWDVVDHILERKDDDKNEWVKLGLKDSKSDIQYYRDTMILPGKLFTYRIGARDRGGNITYSEERSGKIGGYDFRRGIESFMVMQEDKNTLLSWQSVPPGALDRVIIYRAVDDGGLITYKTIGQSEMRKMVEYVDGKWIYKYVDSRVLKSHVYKYTVRLVWQDGNTSRRSEEIEIKFQ